MIRAVAAACGAALLSVLLSGCVTLTAIDHAPPPAEWPALAVEVQRVGFWEMQRVCKNPYPVFLVAYFACALPDLVKRTCIIYLLHDSDEHEKHEREHCEGRDHPGDTRLRDYYERWMKWRGK